MRPRGRAPSALVDKQTAARRRGEHIWRNGRGGLEGGSSVVGGDLAVADLAVPVCVAHGVDAAVLEADVDGPVAVDRGVREGVRQADVRRGVAGRRDKLPDGRRIGPVQAPAGRGVEGDDEALLAPSPLRNHVGVLADADHHAERPLAAGVQDPDRCGVVGLKLEVLVPQPPATVQAVRGEPAVPHLLLHIEHVPHIAGDVHNAVRADGSSSRREVRQGRVGELPQLAAVRKVQTVWPAAAVGEDERVLDDRREEVVDTGVGAVPPPHAAVLGVQGDDLAVVGAVRRGTRHRDHDDAAVGRHGPGVPRGAEPGLRGPEGLPGGHVQRGDHPVGAGGEEPAVGDRGHRGDLGRGRPLPQNLPLGGELVDPARDRGKVHGLRRVDEGRRAHQAPVEPPRGASRDVAGRDRGGGSRPGDVAVLAGPKVGRRRLPPQADLNQTHRTHGNLAVLPLLLEVGGGGASRLSCADNAGEDAADEGSAHRGSEYK
mmetsp:Transcript_22190/g.69611  ORF Transcript_22190/g.69611 Transcript_22190/m.69611 type:complete len:486 (-) Transcript_22190:57-1514(-)